MEKYDFNILNEKIKIYPYLNFNYKQKIQLLKAVYKELNKVELNYLANPDFSSKKMGLLISILKSRAKEEVKNAILNNKNLTSEQLLEIRRSVRNHIPSNIIVDMIENNKNEIEMYQIRNDFLGKKNEEKEIKDR